MRPNSIVMDALRKARLTPRQQYIIGLYLDGWRHREIAVELKCSRQAVTKAIGIGIRKLQGVNEIIRGNKDIQATIYGKASE